MLTPKDKAEENIMINTSIACYHAEGYSCGAIADILSQRHSIPIGRQGVWHRLKSMQDMSDCNKIADPGADVISIART